MLQTINQKKTQMYRRYLGHRDGSERRVREEDELTGLLLGPLAMFPGSAPAIFWYNLLIDSGIENLPSHEPQACRMQFWPRCQAADGRIIEPDLAVELCWPSGDVRRVTVEMKWNAPLSGEDQLGRQLMSQWEGMRFDYLLFIGKDVTEAAGMLASEGDRKKVAAWTWDRIVTFLNHSDILGLETWSYQVVSVLECLGIRGFRGFYVFQMPEVELVNNKRVFWKGEVLG